MSEPFNISAENIESAYPGASQTDVETEVSTAPEIPASSGESIAQEEQTEVQSEEYEASPAPESEDVPAETSQSEPESNAVEQSEKLNWDSAKEQFRDAHKAVLKENSALRAQLAEQQKDTWQDEFMNNPNGLIEKLKSASPVQFEELATPIVTESANSNPTAWAEFLVENHWDAIAPALFGKDITLDQVKKILDASEDPEFKDLFFDSEDDSPNAQPKPDPNADALQRIEKFEQEQRQSRINDLGSRVVADVFKVIDDKLEQFDLKVTSKDTAQDKAWKEHVAKSARRDALDFLQGNSTHERSNVAKTRFDKMNELIGKLDESGARHYIPQLQALIDEALSEPLALFLNKRAEQQQARFTPPVEPKKTVGAGGQVVATEPKRERFSISSDDLAQASI